MTGLLLVGGLVLATWAGLAFGLALLVGPLLAGHQAAAVWEW